METLSTLFNKGTSEGVTKAWVKRRGELYKNAQAASSKADQSGKVKDHEKAFSAHSDAAWACRKAAEEDPSHKKDYKDLAMKHIAAMRHHMDKTWSHETPQPKSIFDS